MTIEQNNIENERILVTGANGFVGSFLTKKLINAGFEVITSTRKKNSISNTKDQFLINSLDRQVNWSKALDNCSTVVHLAARAHKINDKSNNILERYREINTNATINLGKQAIKAGVKKFIFISTIGVNGSKTEELPFINTDKPKPHSPYAISKYEAELGLQKITHNSSMKLIIIRPPLIYNINAPGNIERLKNIVELGLPLPFLGIKNKRLSLIHI